MPWAPHQRCSTPGCPERQAGSRCARHLPRRESRNHNGVSRQARGYGADWDAVRRLVLERDGYACRIRGARCKGKASTVDHIIPRALGGPALDPDNLQAACWTCNYGKGARVVGPTGTGVIRLVGQPASGKSTLRLALGAALDLPTFAIDDLRLALMRPGDVWPEDDSPAWRRLRHAVLHEAPCVIETAGLSKRDAWLYAGVETFTIACVAPDHVRRERLVQRVRDGYPLARTPEYVRKLMALPPPDVTPDAVWPLQPDVVERAGAWLKGRGGRILQHPGGQGPPLAATFSRGRVSPNLSGLAR